MQAHPSDFVDARVFWSDVCVHKVIKGWSNFQAGWFTNIELLDEVYRATRDSAGVVHAVEGPVIHISTGCKRSLSNPNLPMITSAL